MSKRVARICQHQLSFSYTSSAMSAVNVIHGITRSARRKVMGAFFACRSLWLCVELIARGHRRSAKLSCSHRTAENVSS